MTDLPVLLIEDTPTLQLIYATVLKSAGHEVHVAGTAAQGLEAFRKVAPKVAIVDLMLPDGDGLDLMRELLALSPQTPIIVVTANGSINKAVEAMRAGAYEFLVKPFSEQRFLHAVDTALQTTGDRHTACSRKPALAPPGDFVGMSKPMAAVYAKVKSVSHSMASVFITGESGTGKELCAQAIHNQSHRSKGPFVPLNCGAIPSELLESEVFGHMKGSFTGAISDKPGAAAIADGGTLFLDEICELDLNLQTKLLRFLQTSTIQPVGATRPRKVNVRIICATNRDPLDAVRQGQFREDLYYRLHVVPIHMPPLRARGEDIVILAETALARYSHEESRHFTGLDEDVRKLLPQLPWPGNVRQLLNVMRQIVVMNDGPVVTRGMMPAEVTGYPAAGQNSPLTVADNAPVQLDGLVGKTLAAIERLVIEQTVAAHGGSVLRAAQVLDVAPSTLYRKIGSWAAKPEAGD